MPLLPVWYRRMFASTPLPASLRNADPRLATIGDLDGPHRVRGSLEGAVLRDLVALVKKSTPPPDMVVLPAEAVADAIDEWDIRTRTRNCLIRWHRRHKNESLTVGDALAIDCFGITSLIDLMCVAEVQDGSCAGNPFGFLCRLSVDGSLRAAAQDVASGLGRLVDLTRQERTVLDGWLYPTDGRKLLRTIQRESGLSQWRVRNLADSVARKVDTAAGERAGVVSAAVRRHLGRVSTVEHYESCLGGLLFGCDVRGVDLARRVITAAVGYVTVGDYILSGTAVEAVNSLRKRAGALSDDVGLVDEDRLRLVLPDPRWDIHWEALTHAAGLVRLNGFLSRRGTVAARTKAALRAIGEPATSRRIADQAGLPTRRVGYHLTMTPSIVRAGNRTWAVAGWVERPYEGLPKEMVRRIRQGGGKALLSDLAEELPARFGVTPGSVKTVASTQRFSIDDGWATLAGLSSQRLERSDMEIADQDGSEPFQWDFRVTERCLAGYGIENVPPSVARRLGCEPGQGIRVAVSTPENSAPLSVNWRLASTGGATIGYSTAPLRRLGAEPGDQARIVIHSDSVALQLPDRAAA